MLFRSSKSLAQFKNITFSDDSFMFSNLKLFPTILPPESISNKIGDYQVIYLDKGLHSQKVSIKFFNSNGIPQRFPKPVSLILSDENFETYPKQLILEVGKTVFNFTITCHSSLIPNKYYEVKLLKKEN